MTFDPSGRVELGISSESADDGGWTMAEEKDEPLQKGVVTYTKPPQNKVPPSQRGQNRPESDRAK